MFTIRANWITQASLESLFKAGPILSTAECFLVLVTAYVVTDNAFVEITFYPRTLNGRWVKVFIPKNEVLAIAEVENPEDVSVVGFKSLD